jgi:hypothetical protein
VLADITSWDLPDDVFDKKAGEVKPSKPVKKVMKPSKVETKPAVRRSINEVEVCLSFATSRAIRTDSVLRVVTKTIAHLPSGND